jgi:hypothetical protein
MAVRQGFEPWELFTLVGFQDRCFRPLSHLTAGNATKKIPFIKLFHPSTFCKLKVSSSPSELRYFLRTTEGSNLTLSAG